MAFKGPKQKIEKTIPRKQSTPKGSLLETTLETALVCGMAVYSCPVYMEIYIYMLYICIYILHTHIFLIIIFFHFTIANGIYFIIAFGTADGIFLCDTGFLFGVQDHSHPHRMTGPSA